MLMYGLILFYVGQYFICIASVPNKMYIGTKFVFIKIWITEIYKCSYILHVNVLSCSNILGLSILMKEDCIPKKNIKFKDAYCCQFSEVIFLGNCIP